MIARFRQRADPLGDEVIGFLAMGGQHAAGSSAEAVADFLNKRI